MANAKKVGQRAAAVHRSKMQWVVRSEARGAAAVTFAIVVVAMLAVIATVVVGLVGAPELRVKARLEMIVGDYYGDYIYSKLEENAEGEVSEVVAEYAEKGFPEVTLRQLLQVDDGRYADEGELVWQYCEEERTRIKIYPGEPYGRWDYRVEYNYACEW